MIYLFQKLTGKKYCDPFYDMFWGLICFVLFFLAIIATVSNGKGADTVMVVSVGLIGIGLIFVSISAVICQWFDYLKHKRDVEADCYKYGVKHAKEMGQ